MDQPSRKRLTDAANVYSTEYGFTDDVSSQIEGLKSLGPTPVLLSLSIQMRRDGFIHSLAVANSNEVLVLIPDIPGKHHGHPNVVENIHPSIISLFKDPDDVKFTGFHFHRIAILVKAQLGLDVQGYDIISSTTGKKGPTPSPGQMAMCFLNPKDFPQFEVDALWEDVVIDTPYTSGFENLIDRARITANIASIIRSTLIRSTPIQTSLMKTMTHIWMLRDYVWEIELLDAGKPDIRHSETVKEFELNKTDDTFIINNARYKTKLRNDKKTRVVITDKSGKQHSGRTAGAKGKKTFFKSDTRIRPEDIRSVHAIGRESKTNAEHACDLFALRVLQGLENLDESPFIKAVWLTKKTPKIKKHFTPLLDEEGLNHSQAAVVQAMTDAPDENVVLVHGPPGTGKTSTISKATSRWLSNAPEKGTWIVAQSNVGVKNVAESLAKQKVRFRLLVSAEFYVEWHEHLYPGVEEELIRTDELPGDPRALDQLFRGVKVVLCTLSTLSNSSVQYKVSREQVPINHLVVDEASQISVFQYMHLFAQFWKLEKVCFFGDPKQLPPYGEEAAPDLKSIFGVSHLKAKAYLLATQYRMPVPLGDFISSFVYGDKLESKHEIKDPSCVAFVDVALGEECQRGSSFVNEREAQIIISLVRKYYQHENFCVITPYDAQRNYIQKSLEAENLPFENVFNVDSFQGNEAEYILLSIVRTKRPGFLNSWNRVNVMLTRCKQGLLIVTKKTFIRSRTMEGSLLGKMCAYWEASFGDESTWWDLRDASTQVDSREVLYPPTTVQSDQKQEEEEASFGDELTWWDSRHVSTQVDSREVLYSPTTVQFYQKQEEEEASFGDELTWRDSRDVSTQVDSREVLYPPTAVQSDQKQEEEEEEEDYSYSYYFSFIAPLVLMSAMLALHGDVEF